MHRRLKAELLPLDTELESTLRNLKKVRVVELYSLLISIPLKFNLRHSLFNVIRLHRIRLD